MASLGIAEITAVLREIFPDGMDEELVFKDHPLSSMLESDTDFIGEDMKIPIRYGKPSSTSASFAVAQANARPSKYGAFKLTRASRYGVGNITGEAVDLAKRGQSAQFIDELRAEVDGLLSRMGDDLALQAYRGTGGARGTVGSTSGATITLSAPEDVYFFEIGDVLVANDTDDATTVRAGTFEITNVNEDTGVLTGTGTITGLAAGDRLFKQGDPGATWCGLGGYVTATAPAAGTLLYGLDVGVSTRLNGIRFNASALQPNEVFIRANQRIGRSPAKPDYWFVNPKDYASFEVGANTLRQIIDTKYGMGYESIVAHGVRLVRDPDCPVGVAWGVPMSCFWRATLGEAPRVINEDGVDFLRAPGDDAYEIRVVARGNYACDAPGCIVRVQLP